MLSHVVADDIAPVGDDAAPQQKLARDEALDRTRGMAKITEREFLRAEEHFRQRRRGPAGDEDGGTVFLEVAFPVRRRFQRGRIEALAVTGPGKTVLIGGEELGLILLGERKEHPFLPLEISRNRVGMGFRKMGEKLHVRRGRMNGLPAGRGLLHRGKTFMFYPSPKFANNGSGAIPAMFNL